ncbi:Type I Iterative Polyketide synthase (PKS) [Aspergillus melleus]|uniref:Type I Iterative Polyketide synthase (PKS) n=1 Tax=Aspergillus melleus TaxID=138277 RepID=A0ACC3AQP0_9EURO|nr:Type I Iterative Polyketide synthase (PKS) [Aspergillus melleus]
MDNPNEKPSSTSGSTIPNEDESLLPPIAIVGMALRLPGDISTPSSFWSLLMNKTDTSGPIPSDRYNIDAFHSPTKPGMVRPQRGHFLSQDYLNQIDASVFQVAGYEASHLDPQQTLLMEVVWECMESAGQTEWRGREIGFYVGVFGEDWNDLKAKETGELSRAHVFAAGGFALSNRVSYQFDLRGPSATIQTACSSSLTAVHEACQALYTRSCESAIVAGTNMILTPTMTITMSDNRVLSPDGRCKTFDANADGYARGEAVNAVFLKRLDDAVRDGDPIRGVIRSTAANYDGHSSRIFAPDLHSQERVIRQAYSRAGITDLAQTAFVECHGTGTKTGDVVEATAVARAFKSGELYLGAVKPNVGHGEGASGLTGLIKAVLALENRIIPPNIHFETPNPKIPFNKGLRVPVDPVPWPSNRKERVSVNCFGVGGSNAHVIVESASSLKTIKPPSNARARLLVTSAYSDASLHRRISDLQKYLRQNPKGVQDLAYTLGVKRDHLSHRAFMIVNEDGTLEEPILSKPVSPSPIVFAFTGQGTQWPGMAKELVQSVESFRADIKKMDQILKTLPDPPAWDIEDELLRLGTSHRASKAELSQTLCAAVQIALINLFSTWGIRPRAVVGHSSGEIAAAYAAGAIPIESAIIIAYYRGQVAKSSTRLGGMVVVGLGPEIAKHYLVDGVVIACENSPQSVNLSGDKDKLDAVLETILTEHPDTFYRKLPVEVAYHSPHMVDLGHIYEASIRPHISTTTATSGIPMYSTVTGQALHLTDLDAAYWRRNLESPVLFASAVGNLLDAQTIDSEPTLFLEIGAHPALSSPLRQISSDLKTPITHIATLSQHTDQHLCILRSAGHIYLANHIPSFSTLNGFGATLSDLPLYPWDRRNFNRQESRLTRNWRFRKHVPHELLGSRTLESTDLEPSWRNLLRAPAVAWLSDHHVLGDMVFPAAGYIAMIAEAVRQVSGSEGGSSQGCWIQQLAIKTPLTLSKKGAMVEVVTSFKPLRYSDRVESEWWEVTIASLNGTTWTRHCVGQVRSDEAGDGDESGHIFSTEKIGRLPRPIAPEAWYRTLKSIGLQYGPQFQLLEDITTHPIEQVANASVRKGPNHAEYPVHPTVIDQCLQLAGLAACRGRTTLIDGVGIPAFIGSVYIGSAQEGEIMLAQTKGSSVAGTHAKCDARLMTGEKTALSVQGAVIVQLDRGRLEETRPLASHIEWRPDADLASKKELADCEIGESRVLMDRLSALSVIQIHRVIRDMTPLPQYEDYKRLICEAVEDDRKAITPQTQEWSKLDDTALQCLRDGLSAKLKTHGQEEISSLSASVVEACADILHGTVDVAQIVPEKSLVQVHEYTASSETVNQLLSLMCHTNPQLRVFDTGSGPVRLTSCVLKALTSKEGRCWSKYTWSDVSPVAVQAARERYGDKVECCLFDVARDPTAQGLQELGYDVVILSDALRTIPQIDAALQNIKTLLVPGGRIIVQEISPMNYITSEITNAGSLLTSEWNSSLETAGFEDINTIEFDRSSQRHIIAKVPQPALEPTSIDILVPDSPRHPWHKSMESVLSDRGFTVQTHTLDQAVAKNALVISLLDLDGPFFKSITADQLSALQTLLTSAPRILWVTHSAQVKSANPDFGLVLGAARCIRQETGIPFATVEVDAFTPSTLDAVLSVQDKFRRQQSQNGLDAKEYEFAVHDEVVYTGRYHWASLTDMLNAQPEQGSSLKLDIATYGAIGSLGWVPDQIDPLGADDVEVDIRYVGLNFRDIMISLGVMANKEELGIECSGIITRTGTNVRHLHRGQKVGILYPGVFRSRKVVPAHACSELPATMSLDDAAGIMVVFNTVMYSLTEVGRLRKGQSILIQAACGGVGLAAVQLCQTIGAEIYCTVGSEKKAQYLIETFGIPRHRIFNSRDTSFLQGVMRETKGEGVDIVLNSLGGPLLHASWQCVAQFGKMIELGKRDFLEHGMLRMDLFGGNRSFIGVDLFELAKKPGLIAGLHDQVLELFQEDKLQPVRPLKVMPAGEVEQAFRHLQQGLHMGKVVVQIPENTASLQVSKTRQSVTFDPDAAYLLVGGLGGIGRSIATWMVEHGAKHLIFLSRSAGQSANDQAFLYELHVQGCDASAVKGDVSILADVQRAVDGSSHPIRGMLQLSMLTRDQFIRDLTYTNWSTGLASKVTGTWNLHHALQASPLSFFVLCSSIAGLMGSPGQMNYAAANVFLNSFTQFRLQQSLPASVVSLGGVDDIGFLATQNTRVRDNMRAASVRMLQEHEVLDAFEVAITGRTIPLPSISRESLIPQEFAIGMSSTKALSDPTVRPLWGNDARFLHYRDVVTPVSNDRTVAPMNAVRQLITDTRIRIAAARSASASTSHLPTGGSGALSSDGSYPLEAQFTPAHRATIRKALLDGIQTFSIFGEDLDNEALAKMQIDSLMTIELKNWFKRHLGLEVSIGDVAAAGTIGGLEDVVIQALLTENSG